MYKQRSKRVGSYKTHEQRKARYERLMQVSKKVGKGYTGSKQNKKFKDAPSLKSDGIKNEGAYQNSMISNGLVGDAIPYRDLSHGSKPNHVSRAVSIEVSVRTYLGT